MVGDVTPQFCGFMGTLLRILEFGTPRHGQKESWSGVMAKNLLPV